MRAFNRNYGTKNWIRFALKCGLLITDAKVWSAVDHLLSEREEETMAFRSRYENLPRRRQGGSAVRADKPFLSRASTLLGAVGVGFGLGMLLAPVSGEEARAAIRDKALDVKDSVTDVAAWASGFGSPPAARHSTGTYAY
jgi:hypothetical protein